MAALDAAHVAAGAHLFTPEAGRECDVLEGQRAGLQDFAGVEVCQLGLGGRDPPEVILGVVVHGVAKLGQVAGLVQVLLTDDGGEVELGIAVLADVEVEHEGDEGALQAGAFALEDVEAGACELDAAFEVDDVERLAQVPVRPGVEVELAQGADVLSHDIAALVGADWNVGSRDVRDFEHEGVELFFDCVQVLVEDVYGVAERLALRLQALALLGRGLAHLAADGVALGLEVVGLLDVLAAPFVKLEDAVDGRGAITVDDRFLDDLRMFTDELDGNQGLLVLGVGGRWLAVAGPPPPPAPPPSRGGGAERRRMASRPRARTSGAKGITGPHSPASGNPSSVRRVTASTQWMGLSGSWERPGIAGSEAQEVDEVDVLVAGLNRADENGERRLHLPRPAGVIDARRQPHDVGIDVELFLDLAQDGLDRDLRWARCGRRRGARSGSCGASAERGGLRARRSR